MKLLLIGPYPVHNNGISRYSEEFIEEWRKQGHQLTSEKVYFWREKWKNWKWLLLCFTLPKGLDGIVIQFTPTACGPLLPFFLKWAQSKGIPTLLVAHETPSTYSKHLPRWSRRIYNAYERAVFKHVSYAIVHTRFHYQELQSIGVHAKVSILPFPLYGQAGADCPREPRKYWGYFGMISPKKGLDILLQAYQSSPPGAFPPLRIIGQAAPGNEAYLERLKAQVRREYHDDIDFLGYAEDADLPRYFAAFKYAIFPYRWVSQSAALAQVCFHGVPYLAADIPYFEEFHRQYGCGKLFPAENVAGLSQALSEIRDHPADPDQLPFDSLRAALSLKNIAAAQIEILLNEPMASGGKR